MTPKLRLRLVLRSPRSMAAVRPTCSPWPGIRADDPAAETITVMTDAEVHERSKSPASSHLPLPDPAPAHANDTDDRGSTPEQEGEGGSDSGEEEPNNGNGEDEGGGNGDSEDEGGVAEEAADTEPHGPFPGNAQRRRGYTSFAQVTAMVGDRCRSLASAVLALSCLSAYGEWATAQQVRQDLCPDQLGKVNGLLPCCGEHDGRSPRTRTRRETVPVVRFPHRTPTSADTWASCAGVAGTTRGWLAATDFTTPAGSWRTAMLLATSLLWPGSRYEARHTSLVTSNACPSSVSAARRR